MITITREQGIEIAALIEAYNQASRDLDSSESFGLQSKGANERLADARRKLKDLGITLKEAE